MEINGKKVLTLPQQVLQNQKDISELKEDVEQAVDIANYEGEDGIEIDKTNKVIRYTKELYEHRITITDYAGASKLYLTVYSNESSYSDVYDLLGFKRYACSGCYNDGDDRYFIIAVDVDPESDNLRLFINENTQYHIIDADNIIFDDLTTKIL